jgi:endogenous inhibitor of DNA gyrase (YacG/DUF329 family)
MIASCPRCKKRMDWEGNPFRPFCSERCRMIDLGQWISDDSAPAEDQDTAPSAQTNT